MLLKMKDYERIYKIVNSIVKNEGADPSISCIFFAAYGAHILESHYKVSASPKAGLAAYHTGNNNEVICFGQEHEGVLTGELDNFHCWVEADGWVIDFMAPAFTQLKTVKQVVPAKMFHKTLSTMAATFEGLNSAGDFYLESSPASTAKHMQLLSTSMAYKDLAEICSQWFTKPPKKIKKSIQVSDAKGNLNTVKLSGNSIVGAW